MSKQLTCWQTYEEVAVHVLGLFRAEFGLDEVQGPQTVRGHRSGTTWHLEGKGVLLGGQGFVIVECRRHTTERLKHESVAAVAYRIQDTGARGGILVTPIGLQEGAAKVAAAERIVPVVMDATSTTQDYLVRFLTRTMMGASGRDGAKASDSATAVVKSAVQ